MYVNGRGREGEWWGRWEDRDRVTVWQNGEGEGKRERYIGLEHSLLHFNNRTPGEYVDMYGIRIHNNSLCWRTLSTTELNSKSKDKSGRWCWRYRYYKGWSQHFLCGIYACDELVIITACSHRGWVCPKFYYMLQWGCGLAVKSMCKCMHSSTCTCTSTKVSCAANEGAWLVCI